MHPKTVLRRYDGTDSRTGDFDHLAQGGVGLHAEEHRLGEDMEQLSALLHTHRV